MRKTLLAVAVVAAGALAYYQFGMNRSAAPTMAELAFVPADTAVFSGQFTPVDLASYLSSLGMGPQYYDANMQQMFADLALETTEPQSKFLLAMAQTYMKALSEPATLTQQTGIKAELRSLMYLVGLSPVLRLEVADEAAFWQLFDAAEQSSGFVHSAQQLKQQKYRQYRLVNEDKTVDLLISVQQGWATIALTSDKFAAEHLAQVLQVEQPAQNLANSKVLSEMVQKYQLENSAFGFVSFAQLSQFLVSKDGNGLARDVEALLGAEAGVAFADWREPACQTDLAAITKSWPGLYLDSKFDVSNPALIKVSGRFLLPTENKQTVQLLSELRGFLPAHSQQLKQDSLFSAAIGLDVAQLAPTLGKLWTGITEPAYSCKPLAAMQQQMKQDNPLAALAMAGMASALQGVSVTINEVELDLATSNLKNADALVTVSATNARVFVEGLKALYPPLAAVALPAVGETLDLATVVPEVAVLGVKPQLELNDSHLLIYVGEKAKVQAATVAKENLTKNGLFSFGMDYAQFFKAMETAIKASGEAVPADFNGLSNSQMKMVLTADIDQHGLVVKSVMQMAPTKAAPAQ